MQTIVTVCPITGPQFGPLSIPHRLCEECDMTIRVVRQVVDEVGGEDVEVRIRPWLRHMFDVLRRGGWHPPVVMINDMVFSQGVVPDADALKERLRNGTVPQE